MPTFSYTSGNPTNLTGGGSASMGDIQGPFTDLRTFINGGLGTSNLSSTAAITEAQLAAAGNGLAKGAFSAYRNAALNLGNNGVVIFDTEEFDLSGWFDTTTGRYAPQAAGYYRLSWKVAYAGPFTADNYLLAGLYKNGVALKWAPIQYQRGASEISAGASALAVANGSTDYFTVVVQTNQAGGPTVSPGAPQTFFQGELVGRA